MRIYIFKFKIKRTYIFLVEIFHKLPKSSKEYIRTFLSIFYYLIQAQDNIKYLIFVFHKKWGAFEKLKTETSAARAANFLSLQNDIKMIFHNSNYQYK